MALFINENYFDRPDYSDFNIMEESYKFMYEQECAFNTLYSTVLTEGTVGDTLKKWKDKIIEIIKNFIKNIKELFAKFKAKIKSKGKKTNASGGASGSSSSTSTNGSDRLAIEKKDGISKEDIDKFYNNPTPEVYKEITRGYKLNAEFKYFNYDVDKYYLENDIISNIKNKIDYAKFSNRNLNNNIYEDQPIRDYEEFRNIISDSISPKFKYDKNDLLKNITIKKDQLILDQNKKQFEINKIIEDLELPNKVEDFVNKIDEFTKYLENHIKNLNNNIETSILTSYTTCINLTIKFLSQVSTANIGMADLVYETALHSAKQSLRFYYK